MRGGCEGRKLGLVGDVLEKPVEIAIYHFLLIIKAASVFASMSSVFSSSIGIIK